MTDIKHYHVNIADEKNRINALIEECVYDVYGVPHIDMNEFCERLIREVMEHTQLAIASDLPVEGYVLHKFGV